MIELYQASHDPYCYPGTHILKNKWDIRNQELLSEVESTFAQQRIFELYLEMPVSGRFGLRHLQRVHHYIFQDVYSWAGKLRTVRIHKEKTTFAYPEYIKEEAKRIFVPLQQGKYLKNLEREVFIQRLAWYIGEINVLHPFREGNGRALRVFIWLLAIRAGWHIQFEDVNSDEWLVACIASYSGDLEPMKVLLERIVDKVAEQQ
jgi:cell filamentation protein